MKGKYWILHPELQKDWVKDKKTKRKTTNEDSRMHSQMEEKETLTFTFMNGADDQEYFSTQEQHQRASWFVDSDATNHLTFDKSQLHDYVEYLKPKQCRGISSTFFIHGHGTMKLQCLSDRSRTATLSNVNYSP